MSHCCTDCGHTFTTRQAKYKHKKVSCKATGVRPKDKAVRLEGNVETLEGEVKALRAQVAQLMQCKVPSGGTINNTTNNTTINNTTNNITINQFLKEDLTFLAHEIMRDLVKQSDLNESLQKVIKLVHFNPEQPQNQNVYLPDEDAEHGFHWSRDSWEKLPTKRLAKLVMLHSAGLLCEHNDVPYVDEYSHKETSRFNKFYEKVDDDKKPLQDTINTMATCCRSITSPAVGATTFRTEMT